MKNKFRIDEQKIKVKAFMISWGLLNLEIN